MGYPVSYRAARPAGVPNTAAPKRALKVPGRPRPANDNIPRVPPKPANDNIPRIPPKPANDNFKPSVQRVSGRVQRYGWIRGAGLKGNLGGFATGNPLDIFLHITTNIGGALNSVVYQTEPRVQPGTGTWYQIASCVGTPTMMNAFNCTFCCTNQAVSTSPPGSNVTNIGFWRPGTMSNRWTLVQGWRRPAGGAGQRPELIPARTYLPTFTPTPDAMKWTDPMSWPVTANDPGPLRIPQNVIRLRRNNNPNRVPSESFSRGYSVPSPAVITQAPSLINGKGQIEVDFSPDGSSRPVIKPNTHRSSRPPKGVKESKKRITRAAAIVLGIVNETTEAIDMMDCLFRAIPYKRRKAYAAWRAQTQRASIKRKWPSITDEYIDYLVRRVRRNSGQRRDIYKARDAEGKPVHQLMPLALRDDLPANVGPELRDALVKLEKVTVGSKEAGFSIAERLMLIEKHFDEIDWLSKDDQPIDWNQMPSVGSIDGVKGALACMMSQGIDDLLTALPGMTTQQAYHWALDKAGIDPDMITGLEFGPAYNP